MWGRGYRQVDSCIRFGWEISYPRGKEGVVCLYHMTVHFSVTPETLSITLFGSSFTFVVKSFSPGGKMPEKDAKAKHSVTVTSSKHNNRFGQLIANSHQNQIGIANTKTCSCIAWTSAGDWFACKRLEMHAKRTLSCPSPTNDIQNAVERHWVGKRPCSN